MFHAIQWYLEAAISTIIPCLINHTWKNTVAVPGLSTLPADPPLVVTGDYAVEVEFDVPANSVDLEKDVASIDKTKIQSVVINADKAPMEIFTNAANGTGGQNFSLAANKSVAWNLPQATATNLNPITQNITKFYANNSSTTNGVFRAGFLMSI